MRDYPFTEIAMLVITVMSLAVLAKFTRDRDCRAECVLCLLAGCYLCVASIASTVAAGTPVREQRPLPSVRLSDPATFHMSCGPTCALKGVGR